MKSKKLVYFLGITGCVFLALVAILYHVRDEHIAKAQEFVIQNIQNYQTRFFQDQEILSADPRFEFPGKSSDAGPWLNEFVPWTSSNMVNYRPKELSPLWIDPKFAKEFYQHKDWMNANPDLKPFDFSWMDKLSKYDHWDIFRSGPNARLINAHSDSFGIEVPSLKELQIYAKLRLIQGIREKSPLPALREVQQLGRLIYSQETPVSSMIYRSILKVEDEYRDEMIKRKMLAARAWPKFDSDLNIRAKRALYGYSGMVSIWDADVAQKLIRMPAKAGMCGGMNQILNSYVAESIYYQGQFAENFLAMNHFIQYAQTVCRLSPQLLTAVNHPETFANFYENPDANLRECMRTGYEPCLQKVLGFLAPVKMIYGAWVEEATTGSFLRSYQHLRLANESPYSIQ